MFWRLRILKKQICISDQLDMVLARQQELDKLCDHFFCPICLPMVPIVCSDTRQSRSYLQHGVAFLSPRPHHIPYVWQHGRPPAEEESERADWHCLYIQKQLLQMALGSRHKRSACIEWWVVYGQGRHIRERGTDSVMWRSGLRPIT